MVVEAGRALAASGVSQHSLLVLITDGEEAGLLGAAAAAVDRDVGYRIAAYLNVDSIGSSGPSHLFEAGPWQRLDRAGVGARGAAAPRRVVRGGYLSPAAERHRLLDPQTDGCAGVELRADRRQLRLSHAARHGRAAERRDDPSDGREPRRRRGASRSDGPRAAHVRPAGVLRRRPAVCDRLRAGRVHDHHDRRAGRRAARLVPHRARERAARGPRRASRWPHSGPMQGSSRCSPR